MRSWLALVVGIFMLLAGSYVRAGEIECRSSGYRYSYCRADTGNRVDLIRQNSGSACDYGRSWGYDNRGIWVDNGCAATFRFGRDGRSGGNDTGKIIAGVAAVAILGAILSSNNDKRDRGDSNDRREDGAGFDGRAPGWAIGRFSGDDHETGASITLSVDRDGRINGYYGRDDIDGQFDGERAYLGNRGYGTRQTRDGFALTDDDGRAAIDLYRN